MKKITPILILVSTSLATSLTASADPTAYIGIAYDFATKNSQKSGFGLTAKIISDDKQQQAVAGIGVTYYPFLTKKYGFDVSAGYIIEQGNGLTSHPVALVGYDFIQKRVQLSAGWAETNNDDKPASSSPAPATPPVTPPGPGTDL